MRPIGATFSAGSGDDDDLLSSPLGRHSPSAMRPFGALSSTEGDDDDLLSPGSFSPAESPLSRVRGGDGAVPLSPILARAAQSTQRSQDRKPSRHRDAALSVGSARERRGLRWVRRRDDETGCEYINIIRVPRGALANLSPFQLQTACVMFGRRLAILECRAIIRDEMKEQCIPAAMLHPDAPSKPTEGASALRRFGGFTPIAFVNVRGDRWTNAEIRRSTEALRLLGTRDELPTEQFMSIWTHYKSFHYQRKKEKRPRSEDDDDDD